MKHALRVAFLSLPLSTSIHELSVAVLLGAGGVFAGVHRNSVSEIGRESPWLGAACGLALVWVLGALPHGNLHEALGHAWLLAPLMAIPLARPSEDERSFLMKLGLGAAAAASLWGVAQRGLGTVATGGFGHHLTLAYALVPPFAVAIFTRRWLVALLLAAGSLATGSDAAPIALATGGLAALAAARWPGRSWLLPAALAAGAATTLLGIQFLADPDDLRQRAILWTGGLSVPPGSAGAGGYSQATQAIYNHLSTGFYFPNHAHDSAIQLHATLGAAGLAGTAILIGTILAKANPGAAAGLAAILIGGLTQDTLGDLEVARAAWMWVALLGTLPPPESRATLSNADRD